MAYPTNPIYKLTKNLITDETESVKITIEGVESFIPFEEANSDYQTYLEWKAIDGNEPEAAD